MMACATCLKLQPFWAEHDDYSPSQMPSEVAAMRVLGRLLSDARLLSCPSCDAIFTVYDDRDSDTGITQEGLARIGPDRDVKLLLQALEQEPILDEAAIRVALDRRLGPLPPLEELREGVAAGEPRALYQLGRHGLDGAPLVAVASVYVKRPLGAMALAAAGAVDILAMAVADGSCCATQALARSGNPEAEGPLREAMSASSWGVKAAAAGGLARLGVGAELLARHVGPEEAWYPVRQAVGEALARMGAADQLVTALHAADWHTRLVAADGVTAVGQASPEVIAALEDAVLDPRCAVPAPQAAAVRALLAVGVSWTRIRSLLEEGQRSEHPWVRSSSAWCLQSLAPAE